jgi:hypothetical protein
MYGFYHKFCKFLSNLFPGTGDDLALTQAAAVILNDLTPEPITVTRFGFVPTVVFAYGTNPTEGVLTLYRYPVAGGTNKVALATIPLKDLAAVDNVYYVDVVNPPVVARGKGRAEIDAGERVVIEVTTQAAGGTGTGNFQPFYTFHPRDDVQAAQPKMHNYVAYNTITT